VIESLVLYQELLGDAYWYKERGPLGTPIALYPLMSQYVRVVRDEAGRLTGYLYGRFENQRMALTAADIIHFKYPNPDNPDYGQSPLEGAFGSVALLEAEQEYMTTMFDSGGMPEVALVVRTEGGGEDERTRLYAEWRRRFANKRRGEKAIILQGDMDIKTFGYPPADTGIQFAQNFSREEVAAAFGVPMTMIQLSEASRAGAEAGQYAYMQFTIAPKLRRIEQKLNEQLCHEFDERLFLAFDPCVPDDKDFRLREITTRLDTGMTTINEERAIAGLPPVAWGNVPMITRNSQLQPPPTAPKHIHSATCGCQTKGVRPLTARESKFSDALEGYLVGMVREVDGKLREEV